MRGCLLRSISDARPRTGASGNITAGSLTG